MREINIGLLGFGTVGTGVAKLLIENKELLTTRVGTQLNLKWIADIDTETDRGIRLPDGVLTNNAQNVVCDPEIDIVIEMIGGEGIAKDFILKAIENGKHIVTANKALLAGHGNKLFAAAAQKGVDLAFEASVGGCMPTIKSMRESLVANHINAMTRCQWALPVDWRALFVERISLGLVDTPPGTAAAFTLTSRKGNGTKGGCYENNTTVYVTGPAGGCTRCAGRD